MPTQPRKNLLGFIDPISIIGVLFLIVTLAIGTVVTTNKDSSLNIAEKAGGNCGYCNGKTCISCGGGRIDLGDCTSNAQCGGSVCGDGQCQSGETAQNCASDCGSSDTPRCGDGNCNGRETPGNCSIDCDSEPPVCQPNCSGKSCGDNGCGGSCGTCSSGLSCVNNNCTFVTPTCQRNCTGKTCGDDGCGSSCGTCSSGLTCINNSCTFVTPTNSPYTCQPNCSGKTCGDDGCGGNCGTCGSGLSCQYGSCTYVTPTNSPYCQRNCTGKTCGDDGCGGNCGTCGSGLSCQYGSCTYVTPTNSPACTPNCTNKCGGSNGCGGTCSNSCPSGLSCVNNSCTFVTPPNGTNPTPKAPVATPPNITNNSTCGGTCQSNETCVLIGYGYYGCQANGTITQCTPNCTNKCGGSNGCGGTCSNNCAAGLSCVNNSCTFVTPTNGTNPTPIAYGMDEDFRVNRVDDTAQNIVTPPAQYSFCNGKSSQCNSTLSFFDSLIPDSYISYWQGQTGNQAVNFNNLVLATYKMVTPDFIANPILEKLGLRDEADSYLDIAFNQQTTLDTADLITFDKTSRYVSNYQRINEQTYDPNSNGVVNYLNSFNAGIRDKETLASTIDLGVTLTTEAYALTVAAPLALTSGGIIPGAVSLMGQAQVVSTVMQTGGTASYCALNGWDEICQQQAARTALSWTTIGVSQYSNSASTALSRVANTVVSGANLAVDSADAVTAFSDPNADTLTKAMSLIAVVGDVGGGIADFNQGQLGFGGADLKVIKNDITDMLSTNNIAPNNLPKVADIPKDIPLVEIPVTPKVVADAGNADLPVVKPADVPKADVPVVERITNWVEDMTGNKKVTEAEKILNQTDLNVKSDYDGITKRFTENAPYEPKASAKTPASDLETTVLQKIKNISSPEELPTFKTAVLDNSYAKTPISTDIIKAQTLEEAKAILAREGVDLQIVDDDFLPGNAEAWAPTVKKIFVSESASNDWVVLKSSLAHETTHIDMLRTGDQILAEIGTGSYLGDAPISNAIRNVGQEDWAYVNGAKAALNELENNPNLTQAQKDLLQKKVDDSMKFYNWVVYGDVRPPVTTPPSLIAKVQGQVEDAWNNLTGKDSVPETTFYPKGDPDLEGSVVKVNPDRTIEVQSNMFENHTFVKIKDGDNIPGLPDSQVILVGDNYYVIFKERITQLDNTNSIVVPLNSNPPKKPLLEYVGLVDPNSKALDIAVDDYMSKSLKYVPSNEETIEILIKNGYRPQDINPDVLTDFRNKVISKIQSPSNLSTAQVDEEIKKTPLYVDKVTADLAYNHYKTYYKEGDPRFTIIGDNSKGLSVSFNYRGNVYVVRQALSDDYINSIMEGQRLLYKQGLGSNTTPITLVDKKVAIERFVEGTTIYKTDTPEAQAAIQYFKDHGVNITDPSFNIIINKNGIPILVDKEVEFIKVIDVPQAKPASLLENIQQQVENIWVNVREKITPQKQTQQFDENLGYTKLEDSPLFNNNSYGSDNKYLNVKGTAQTPEIVKQKILKICDDLPTACANNQLSPAYHGSSSPSLYGILAGDPLPLKSLKDLQDAGLPIYTESRMHGNLDPGTGSDAGGTGIVSVSAIDPASALEYSRSIDFDAKLTEQYLSNLRSELDAELQRIRGLINNSNLEPTDINILNKYFDSTLTYDQTAINESASQVYTILDKKTNAESKKILTGIVNEAKKGLLIRNNMIRTIDFTQRQLDNYPLLQPWQKDLLDDSFPVVYGIQPQIGRESVFMNRSDVDMDMGFQGGFASEEVKFVYVPKSEIPRLEKLWQDLHPNEAMTFKLVDIELLNRKTNNQQNWFENNIISPLNELVSKVIN